ncbi:extracellular solute-binding protein [Nocardioides pyridinolyticus]
MPVLAAAVLALVALAACGGPGGAGSTADTEPTSVNTDVADTEASITVFTGAGTKDFNQALADAFHAKYPKIDVTLQVEADNNYNTVLPRLLASNDPPDLAAPADLIGSVEDGLVTNLDKYSEAYGWDSKVPASILDAGRVVDGRIGSGSLYVAGGAAGPLVGVYYNRELADEVGMTEVPATIADLEAVMAKAKDAGITPIVASNADGLIGHLYNLLLGSYMGPQSVLDVVWRAEGATLDTPEAVEATTLLKKWADAGYFNSNVNAINQDASYGQFASGDGLFMFQGTWMTQALPEDFDGKYGIFPMPPQDGGGPAISMTGNSLAFGIAAHSDAKDAAALYLDFLSTSDAATVAVAHGYPSVTDESKSATITLDDAAEDQIQAGYAVVASDDGFFSWIQNAVPEVNTQLTTDLQSLVGDKTSPEEMVESLQAAYESGL